MARIPLIDENDPTLAPETRAMLDEAAASRGRLVNLYRALANRPAALQAFTGMADAVYRRRSSLAPKHGELAYFTATATNRCYY
jgi:alkylhydroperoxidase family enzyme